MVHIEAIKTVEVYLQILTPSALVKIFTPGLNVGPEWKCNDLINWLLEGSVYGTFQQYKCFIIGLQTKPKHPMSNIIKVNV